MNIRQLFAIVIVGGVFSACKQDIDAPVLPTPESTPVAQAVTLDPQQLFGVWGASSAYGTTSDNYFEQSYQIDFQDVETGEAIFSHWFTSADSESRDSLYQIEYTYTFDGASIDLKPKAASALNGATAIHGVHVGNNQMVLYTFNDSKTDTICTLRRIGDPVPSIAGVDRTMPAAGDTVTISGRNLQFVDHVYLPTAEGWQEVKDVVPGSTQIKVIIPEGEFVAGSIRCQATSSHQSCYTPAYMFCRDMVFFHNFSTFGTKAPYTGTEFEYTINAMGTIRSNAVPTSITELPADHALRSATAGINHPDSLLSLFGEAPAAWPVSSTTNSSPAYIRFSSADRFQYAIDHSGGLLNKRTPCAEAAIQMEVYAYTDGKPVWNTGYVAYRMNKDQHALASSMVATGVLWEEDAPASFQYGWKTLTIPLAAFAATHSPAMGTLGNLINSLKSSNMQTILTMVNYPMDALHPAWAPEAFQFCIANIRLVPYAHPANTKE